MADKKDELVIEVPENYDDTLMEDQHMVQVGDNIITCKTILRDPLKLIGTNHYCTACCKTFKVVKEKLPIVKANTGTEG